MVRCDSLSKLLITLKLAFLSQLVLPPSAFFSQHNAIEVKPISDCDSGLNLRL